MAEFEDYTLIAFINALKGTLDTTVEADGVISTPAQAIAGTNNTTIMTPLRVAQALSNVSFTFAPLDQAVPTSNAPTGWFLGKSGTGLYDFEWQEAALGGSVQTVSVASANGLAGTSDGDAVNPVLTLSTTLGAGEIPVSNGTGFQSAPVTGAGSIVLATSPTLVNPALGTPSALVGTNITGTAAGLTAGNVTTNANLTGDVTSVGNVTTLTNAPVIAKVLTGYTSGAGTVSATDSILQAIQKLNGNDATNANLTGPITSVGNATSIASQTGSGTKFVVDTSPTIVTPTISTNATISAAASPSLILSKGASGNENYIQGQTNGSLRWLETLGDFSSESGGNAGSNYSLASYTDASSPLRTAISIIRSSGDMVLGSDNVLINSASSGSAAHSTPRLALRSNDTVTPNGAGGFLVFQSPNSSAVIRDAIEFNGGLVVATAGAEQGLFDIASYRAGVSEVCFTLDSSIPAVFPGSTTGVYGLGTSTARWAVIYANALATSVPVTKTGTSGTVGALDSSVIINASGTYTLTLPAASSFPGRWLNLKSIANQTVNSASSNVVPIGTAAAGTALLTATAGKWARLQSDGTNWVTMASN